MKFKKLPVALLSVLMLSIVLIPAANATTFPNLPPTPVTINQAPLTIYTYPFASQLSNVPGGYDVSNGIYTGWCIDLTGIVTRGTDYEVMLYSSLSPPAKFASIPWDMINYILNHKQGSGIDVQEAIWYFINGNAWPTSSQLPGWPYPTLPPTTDAQAMVTDALANGSGYTPGVGDVVAVICDPTDVTVQWTIIELLQPGYPKQFTSSYAIADSSFAAPTIIDGGLTTSVVGIHSGPRVFWVVTYYFANTEEYLGSQYDGEGHYFRLWDKWGANLMVLDSQPTAFDPDTNIVTLADATTFEINPDGYKTYVGTGLSFTDSNGNPAIATLHTGDMQENTNPGKGKGTQKDGKSYDMDIVWDIGYLAPGESASLSIIVAPGKNPGGKLAFSSPGYELINTGPRARVYADAAFTDFLYAIENTVQLGVIVTK